MKFDVQSVSRDIADSRRRAQALIDIVSGDQLTRRPDPGKWSIAECIAHLNMTAATVQKLMARGIEQAKQEKRLGEGPFSIGPKGRLLVWIAEPPPKFRIRAPKNVRPPAAIDDPRQLLPAFMKAQDEWERLMREQEGLDLAGIKVGQGAFRMRLAAALPWMMAHQRRHLLQAENVKRQILSAASKTAAQRASRPGEVVDWLWRIGNARSKACSIDMDAGARAVAWLGGTATSAANADQSRALVQLPR